MTSGSARVVTPTLVVGDDPTVPIAETVEDAISTIQSGEIAQVRTYGDAIRILEQLGVAPDSIERNVVYALTGKMPPVGETQHHAS